MNSINSGIEELIEELLALLDADAVRLGITLSHLNNLRAGVIKRDEAAMAQLLETIKSQQDDRDAIENKRSELRQIAAAAFGCTAEEVNLSRIMEHVTPELRPQVAQRQQTLSRLVLKLKTEYTATAMLLNECSRFNRMLLDSIVGSRCKGVTTYNASGQMKRPNGSSFVAMQF
jgi:hypothetical protein